MNTYDYLMKFILVGDSGTGKTSLLNRILKDKFVKDIEPTIGVEFGSLKRVIQGKNIKI